MATVDAFEGFERVLPARGPLENRRGRGGEKQWAWWVPTVGLGVLFLVLEVLVQESGAWFWPNRVRGANTGADRLVDVGGVDLPVSEGRVLTPSGASDSSEASETSETVAPNTTRTALDDQNEMTWSMLLPSVTTDARVFASRGAHATLGFVCFSSPIPGADAETIAITRFTPVTTRPDHVHHITVFGCDARVEELYGGVTFGQGCATWGFAMAPSRKNNSQTTPPCRVVLYAYDKGAAPFVAPEGTAVHAGAGTGITHVMYQVHYLAPLEGGDEKEVVAEPPAPWPDRSGVLFDLVVGQWLITEKRITKRLGILATMHTKMTLPAGEKNVEFEYAVGPFAKRLAPDFASAGGVTLTSNNDGLSTGDERNSTRNDHAEQVKELTLVAAHMHGHGMLTRYEFGVVRGGERIKAGVLEAYGGYGSDQSFQTLPVERVGNTEGSASNNSTPGKTEGSMSDDSRTVEDKDVFGGVWRTDKGGGDTVKMRVDDLLYVKCTFDTRGAKTNTSREKRVGGGTDARWSESNVDTGDTAGVPSTNTPRGKNVPYGVGHGEEMCGQLVYYYPFVTRVGVDGGMVRPEPALDDLENARDNDLFNIVFGDRRVNSTTSGDGK